MKRSVKLKSCSPEPGWSDFDVDFDQAEAQKTSFGRESDKRDSPPSALSNAKLFLLSVKEKMKVDTMRKENVEDTTKKKRVEDMRKKRVEDMAKKKKRVEDTRNKRVEDTVKKKMKIDDTYTLKKRLVALHLNPN